MQTASAQNGDDKLSVDTPWLLKRPTLLDEWRGHGKVQVTLANFASNYKRGNQAKLEGKAQAPMNAGEGKDRVAFGKCTDVCWPLVLVIILDWSAQT